MMTITIEAPEALVKAIIQDATLEGLSVQEYALIALSEKATGRERADGM